MFNQIFGYQTASSPLTQTVLDEARSRGHESASRGSAVGGMIGGLVGSFGGPFVAAAGAASGAGVGYMIGSRADEGEKRQPGR